MQWRSLGATALLIVAPQLGAIAQESAADTHQPSDAALERIDALDVEIEEFVDAWRAEQRALRERAKEEAAKAEAEGREASFPAMSMRPDFTPFVERLFEWADV